MKIIINGVERDTAADTLAALLSELGLDAPHIATARNGVFAPRVARTEITLSAGDRIEILAPMQGG